MYSKQHLKFALVTTKTHIHNNFIKSDTELCKEYWEVKQQKGIPVIKWKVLRKCHAYNQKKCQCILRLNEKCEIACYNGDNLLNKRTEIPGTYRYKSKYKLKTETRKTDLINQSHNVVKSALMQI